MNVITIELCAEDRARLDKVIELLGGLRRPDCASCVEGVASYMAKAAEVMDAQPAVAPAKPPKVAPVVEAPVPEAEPVKAPSFMSLAEFQKALTLRCAESAEMKARVRALLNEYAASASAVPEEKRAEIVARMQQL